MKRAGGPWIAILGSISASVVGCCLLAGCGSKDSATKQASGPADESMPVFTLAWSEYPSWSVFGVADELELVNGEEGKVGEIEKKWGVDIVLKEAGYDSCLNMYSSNNCDAVCMTNMDALIVSPQRNGVAFLPTSTSDGADACIVVGVNNLDELKPHDVYGLKGTVSEYCFVRCIEEIEKKEQKGYKPEDFKFTNQDPAAAAVAMQQKQDSHKAIMVWNPFVLQTLKDRPEAKVLFSSSMIPGEIVDMVVLGKDVLDKPGASRFAMAVLDTFYTMNEKIADSEMGDATIEALGKKFSSLNVEEMKQALEQTRFYKTADDAINLLQGDAFRTTMDTVQAFCTKQGLVENPSVGYERSASAGLIIDPSFLEDWKMQL